MSKGCNVVIGFAGHTPEEEMQGSYRCQVRVRYADTDAMGVAYNSQYLVWFEVGRTEWMRSKGLPYRTVEERGVALPVVEATLRFRTAARYDDLLDIETRLDDLRSRRVVFAYRISLEERCVAEGTTVHVPVERTSGRSARLPGWLMDALAREGREDPHGPARVLDESSR